jgi:hypothetical protein
VATYWGSLISYVEPFLEATNLLCQIMASLPVSASAQADDGAANVQDNKREKRDGSKTTPRSMKGLARIAGATIKLPMDMTLAMTQGLHNAPSLAVTARRAICTKVTGVGSGLKVAGKERKPANQLNF